MAADAPPAPAPAMTPTPAGASKGEFDNSCAMGMAEGQTVKTDCSVNWTADDGKVYCFSSEASKEAFLKNPTENIQKAKEFFLAKDLAKDGAAPAAAAPSGGAPKLSKAFTEDDVNAVVKKVVDEKTKDGTFVFHDPKLDALSDLESKGRRTELSLTLRTRSLRR
jgi:YHS domain-containing protein